MEINTFKTLNKINVDDKIEKKGNLDYLPWADAWTILSNNFTDINYSVIKSNDGCNYHHDGKTAWVETTVSVNGKNLPEQLPIMDNRNKSILLENITSFEVNRAIKRCFSKNIALHGLGLYLWTKSGPQKEMLTDYQYKAVLEKGTRTQAETVLKKWDATPEQLRKIKDKFKI